MFCNELVTGTADRDLSWRNDHVPGEKAYFDFAGLTLGYQDGATARVAQVLVAALGYSYAIFAHAYAEQTVPSWLDRRHRAFVAWDGVPRVGVPDNPKALVTRADRYEPRLSAVCVWRFSATTPARSSRHECENPRRRRPSRVP